MNPSSRSWVLLWGLLSLAALGGSKLPEPRVAAPGLPRAVSTAAVPDPDEFARRQNRLLVKLDEATRLRLPLGDVFATLAIRRRLQKAILGAPSEDELNRWELAVDQFSAAGAAAVPKFVADLVDKEGRAIGVYPLLLKAGIEDPRAFVLAMMRIESSFDPDVISPAGAKGLMQVMPETAAKYVVSEDLHDLPTNVRAGLSYLKETLQAFGRVDYALAAYNSGITRTRESIKQYGDIPPIPETRAYVRKVLAEYRRLARAPKAAGASLTQAPAAAPRSTAP